MTHRVHFPQCAPIAAVALSLFAIPGVLTAQGKPAFNPGNLVVSRTVYDNRAGNVTVGQTLPPGCVASTGGCVTAVADGTYPYVFNNDPVDGSFGITSRIFLDHSTPSGNVISSLEVPTSQLVTSFSSKSELALHLSTDGRYITFMGYYAPVDTLDVSNSNTPAAFDPTNPVPSSYYRAVAQVDRQGHITYTLTNAYSGNNGRGAILNNSWGNDVYYAAGNAGNGGNPQPTNVVLGAGAQFIVPSAAPEADQTPGLPMSVGSFSVTELGYKADKVGKDDNFRGLTVFNNVLYYTKGSGGNGINTVYFVDTTGKACPSGVGLPSPSATLPTTPIDITGVNIQKNGVPTNMCVLAGFPTLSNKSGNPVNFPFSLWFADANTLYVADEGDGTTTYDAATNTYTDAAGQTLAGLEKWVFDASSGQWKLAYTLTNGLNLGTPYTVAGYPTGTNAATGLPWSPATDGLRNITGRVNDDGTVTLWGITSTVSGNGDAGADPNRLVSITDVLSNTSASAAAGERFRTLRTAAFGEALRGVSFGPIN